MSSTTIIIHGAYSNRIIFVDLDYRREKDTLLAVGHVEFDELKDRLIIRHVAHAELGLMRPEIQSQSNVHGLVLD